MIALSLRHFCSSSIDYHLSKANQGLKQNMFFIPMQKAAFPKKPAGQQNISTS
jgi:hypothetical protein